MQWIDREIRLSVFIVAITLQVILLANALNAVKLCIISRILTEKRSLKVSDTINQDWRSIFLL